MSDTTDDTGELDGTDVESYGAAIAELERIVAELDGDDVDVDQLAEQVERAAVLVKECRSRLERARSRVTEIVAELDGDPNTSP